jgi:YgiT-type zinc finger domain-containing protein
MDCVSCDKGQLKPGTGTFEADHQGTNLVVTDVPALVCAACGAEYFEGTIALEIIEAAEQAARQGVASDRRAYCAA